MQKKTHIVFVAVRNIWKNVNEVDGQKPRPRNNRPWRISDNDPDSAGGVSWWPYNYGHRI